MIKLFIRGIQDKICSASKAEASYLEKCLAKMLTDYLMLDAADKPWRVVGEESRFGSSVTVFLAYNVFSIRKDLLKALKNA